MEIKQRPQTASIRPNAVVNPFAQSNTTLKGSTKNMHHMSYKDYTIKEENSFKIQKVAKQNVSDLKTTVTSLRPSTAHTETIQQFKQIVQQKFNHFLDNRETYSDDDSILKDSQISKTRDEKQQILEDQKQKRRLEARKKKLQEEEAARNKKQQLLALEKRQKSNLLKQTKRNAKSKSREKSQELKLRIKTAELVKRHRPGQEGEVISQGAVAQLQDLRSWIETQMHEEKLDETDCAPSETKNTTATANKTKENLSNNTAISTKEVGATSGKKKQQIQNHQLPGNSKLSEEEDQKLGARQNRYGAPKTGPNDFQKVVEIQREKIDPQPATTKITPEQQQKGKEHVKQMILQLAQRTGFPLPIQKQVITSFPKSISPTKDQLSEDSCDKVPVRDNSKGHRSIVNQKAKETDVIGVNLLPGVTETKKTQSQIDQTVKDKELKAVLVIQKFLRGHWGRREFSRQLYRRRHEIEMEYGRFDRNYKQNNEYNIKKYLNDKQKIRKITGLNSINEEIVEVIGESSGSAAQVSSSLKLQNFFKANINQPTEFDPLSLIGIYVKRQNNVPNFNKQDVNSKIKPVKVGKQDGKNQTKQKKKQVTQSSSEIVEDIYSEKFDDEISEDIQQISSSISSAPIQRNNKPSKAKLVVESDSIVDEVVSAHISKSGDGEESILDEATSAVDASKSESSILEDSVIRDEFASNDVKVSQAQKQLEARNRGRFGISTSSVGTHQQQVFIKAEEEKAANAVKHKIIVSDLLSEMKEYEAANINSNMMDRMEKIVISSLAQKDQIIMAQSLAELEREIRHKDEINRIREEQIKLMSQLILLGGLGGGASAPAANQAVVDQERKELFNSIQQIVKQQQPIYQQTENTIREVPLTHQQLYQQSQRKSTSYLEEYDKSKQSQNFINSNKFQNFDQSDFSKKSDRKKSQPSDEDDEIIDEIGSVQDGDSIVEDIEESYASSSGSFEDFKKRQYKLVNEKKMTLENLSIQIEQAIDREKDSKEQRLNNKLRRRKISPRTFSTQRSNLEQWATQQRKELREQHRKLTVEQQIAEQNEKLVAEAKTRQARVSGTTRLVEDSNDSETIKQAINQTHLLDKGLIGVSADSRYVQRKNEAAERLLTEKEKAIQEQLNQKMRSFEKEQAEENLKRALDLNVEQEVQRRFEALKKQLEESQGLESARSAISQSRDSSRIKKNVKFADHPSVQPQSTHKHSHTKSQENIETSNNGIDESIQESIVDSYSQSFKSNSVADSKQKSDKIPPKPALQQQLIKAQTQPPPIKAKENVDQSNSIAEMISDNYSEDFGISSENLESNKFNNSKNKLQNKAKDLTQSEQYSEDDFENFSAEQSQQITSNQFQDKTPKMESVKEESIDHSSKSESSRSPQQQSLPSEDVTIQNSARSVDWQINVPLESARTGQDYSQDNFDESELHKDSIKEESSLNDRIDDERDYESNHDEAGRSASQSDDINSKADKIAQELLDLILAEYKGDNTYIVSCEKKQIDEDEFKNKFPFTLDVRPVEPEIRPPQPQSNELIHKPVSNPVQKTTKQIQDEAYLKKFEQEQLHLKQKQDGFKEYLEFLIKRVDYNQLIQALDTPIQQNPLQVLAQIQAYDDEEPPQIAEEPEQQQILTQAFFNKIDREFFSIKRLQNGSSNDLTSSQDESEKIQNVHNYALFEALNEALDLKRPYKNRGGPMPWSKNTRVVKQSTSIEQAKMILDSAMIQVLEWSSTGAGSKIAPLPPPPTQTQDEFGDEIVQPPLQDGEEERRNQHRQEKLGQLMTQDIQETDMLWTDYEVEDTQARFDLADMILADLAAEIAELLM